jgi:cystathionine beta-lyase/cystathionine gamma-synthase
LDEAITDKTKVVYFETPANPNLELIDIEAIVKKVAEYNKNRSEENQIKVVVDNTFATPFCQRPLEWGVDFVVHSLTKNIGGFGTDIGGVVIGKKKYRDILMLYRKDFGGVLSSKSAWPIMVYGLPSLAIRMIREIDNAMKVAQFLAQHPKVEFVNYPGLPSFKFYELAKKQMRDFHGNFAPGNMIYFALKGNSPEEGREKGRAMMNYIAQNAYTLTLAVSLGHVRTLIEHPGSMTHSMIPAEEQIKEGIDPAGIRMSIGLETADDIIKDLEDALNQV